MDIDRVIEFATENNVTPTELLSAAGKLIKDKIAYTAMRLKDHEMVFDKNRRPGAVATCFDSCMEVWVNRITVDEYGELHLDVTAATGDEDHYQLEYEDLAWGSLRTIA